MLKITSESQTGRLEPSPQEGASMAIILHQLARKFSISKLLDDQKSSVKIIIDDHGDVYFPKI